MTLDELVAWLEARAHRQDDGCLVWKLSFNGNQPQARMGGTTVNVRRMAVEIKTGKPLPRKWAAVCSCPTEGCVEPKHLKGQSRSRLLSGKQHSAKHRLAETLAARQKANAKLTPEAVEDIRTGPGSITEKAARHGVNRRHIWDIQKFRSWRDLGNPWAGLGG
jgi:hypothetical protein